MFERLNPNPIEIARIEAELRSSKVDPTMIHLAACVSRSPALSSLAAKLVVSQRNAAVYDSILRVNLFSSLCGQ